MPETDILGIHKKLHPTDSGMKYLIPYLDTFFYRH